MAPPTAIVVNWDVVPPIDQNGVITMYEVLYEPLETFGGAIGPQTATVPGVSTSVTLTQLEEYVIYSIRVRAFTSEGPGGYNAAVQIKTPQNGKYCYSVSNY